MALFDNAKAVFDKGMEMAEGAVDSIASVANDFAIEQMPFTKSLVELCSLGAQQGWNEANGGNVSYRLTKEEIESCKPAFTESAQWNPLGIACPEMAEEFFLLTGSGKYLSKVKGNVRTSLGIVEIDAIGENWRLVWGFENGARPTSELPSHILIHGQRSRATDGETRILYHAHPENIVALTMVTEPDAKTITRALWGSLTECILMFPEGLGYVPWFVPGSIELANYTSKEMACFKAVVWAHHGLLTSGSDFDEVYGLAQTADKAASIYLKALASNGGSGDFASRITDENLLAFCHAYNLPYNKDFLNNY